MKYYRTASTIEIKTAVLPCREIYTKNYIICMPVMVILSNFIDHFYRFFVILLIIFKIFLGHQNPGPCNNNNQNL